MKHKSFLILTLSCAFLPWTGAHAASFDKAPMMPPSMTPDLLILAQASVAGDVDAQAQSFIGAMGTEAIDFLEDDTISTPEKQQRFAALLDEKFDMATIGRFCLGQYWKTMTPEQQTEYQSLFKDLIVAIYSAKFSDYNGQKFQVDGSQKSGSEDILVKSVIVPSDGKASVPVDWRVRSKDGQQKIIDVNVEGVSMALTKKSEFSSIIQRAGGNVESLLVHLRQKEMPKAG